MFLLDELAKMLMDLASRQLKLVHPVKDVGPNFWGLVGRGLLLEGSWYPSMVLRPSANQKVVLRTMKTSSAKGQNWFCEPTGFYEPQWGSEWSLVSPELRPGSSLRPKCGA